MSSIEFVYVRQESYERVRQILKDASISIVEEKLINNGVGLKFVCDEGSRFVIYYRNDKSSKIVFEKAEDAFKKLFYKHESKEPVLEKIPIYASFSIDSENIFKIKNEILNSFDAEEQEPTKTTIIYAIKIIKGDSNLTITQYKTGKILLQGLDSPLVSEVKTIIGKYNFISEKEDALTYVPQQHQKEVANILDNLDTEFKEYCEKARERLSKDAFNYLYVQDKELIISAFALLDVIKETKKELPLYNPIIYPISIAFEGFLVKMLLERNVVSEKEYKDNPDCLKIGNWLRRGDFKRYIKDIKRDGYILEDLQSCWEGVRCNNLHSDPMHNLSLKKLSNISQAEDIIGRVFSSIKSAFQIIVKDGYTEEEMLVNKKNNINTEASKGKRKEKEIPVFSCHIGTDESGKGDYFGPLVIAGVFVSTEEEEKLIAIGVRDSKKNSDAQNNEIAKNIFNLLGKNKISVIAIGPEKYNELYESMGRNTNTILGWGHARAIENLLTNYECDNAIADQFGNESIINKALMEKGKKIKLIQTPKAERDIGVAAASILARSRFIYELNKLSSLVGFTLPKGASYQVEEIGKKMTQKYGESILKKYAKLHFKTTKKIMGEL